MPISSSVWQWGWIKWSLKPFPAFKFSKSIMLLSVFALSVCVFIDRVVAPRRMSNKGMKPPPERYLQSSPIDVNLCQSFGMRSWMPFSNGKICLLQFVTQLWHGQHVVLQPQPAHWWDMDLFDSAASDLWAIIILSACTPTHPWPACPVQDLTRSGRLSLAFALFSSVCSSTNH